MVDEIGDCAGANRSGTSRTERKARTDASDVEAGEASPSAPNRRAQQRAFDRFRREYNEERPHEALEMQTPAAVYRPSERCYPPRVAEPEYGNDFLVRRVPASGDFNWKGQRIFLSETLIGEPIGLLPLDERVYTVYFAAFPIARFDSHRGVILPLPKQKDYVGAGAGEEEVSPSPAPHPLEQRSTKVSGMCPV